MKFQSLRKGLNSLLLIVCAVLVLQGKGFAGKEKEDRQIQKFLTTQAKLVELGYDPSVAERIVKYRPDLSYLITSPEVLVHPDQGLNKGTTPWVDLKWFESQIQDRSPITVYRGLTFSEGKGYDPTYFYKGDLPVIDPRIFTSDNLLTALGYAVDRGQGKRGLLLRMQIPQFMLYEMKPGPYGLVFFRDVVPNELVFVNGVAHISPEIQIDESSGDIPAQLKTISETIHFDSFEESYPTLSTVAITREERIGPDGRFLLTQSWVNSICNVANHSAFKLLLTEISQKSDSEKFASAFDVLEHESEEVDGEILFKERVKALEAQSALGLLSITSPDKGPIEAFLLAFVAGSAKHCLYTKKLWLEQRIHEIKRKQTEAQFFSTYKALHGLSDVATPESKLVQETLRAKM